MALKDTCKTLRSLLEEILADLQKADAGNKAAAQRVRTQSIKFEKCAKMYRKESIKADKSGHMKKAKEANRKKVAKPVPSKAATVTKTVTKPAAASKKRAPAKKAPPMPKRPTAKLPRVRKKKR